MKKAWEKFKQTFGPGIVTGASDDDPSGIAAYTQAGAMFGLKFLWTALATYPMMVAIQEMCARIGIVTKQGLTGLLKRHYPRWVMWTMILFSAPAIVLNISADIAGMAAVSNLLLPTVPAPAFAIFFAALLLYMLIRLNYRHIANILQFLCLALVCYIIVPFLSKKDWGMILMESFIPDISFDRDSLSILVAILGTTISPYLFFWQTSMEVEEVRAKKLVVNINLLRNVRTDVRLGIAFSNLITYFIILAAGTELFPKGITNIQTVDQAALALKPVAGSGAYLLFAIGVIGTGLLAIPVLAGSLSYMFSEALGFKEGLNKKFHQAKGFYIVMIVSVILALVIVLIGVNPVKALIYTAILYGLTAPVLIAIILHICNNRKVMKTYTNSLWSNLLGFITLTVMTLAALALLYQMYIA
jgi:NRAMP (natural resistance-associated macrophage protein)-like metal ion transporter